MADDLMLAWIQFAIDVERRGKEFYEKCLAKMEDQRAQEMFKFLIDQETQHAKLLTDLLNEKAGGDQARINRSVEDFNKMGSDDTMFQSVDLDTITNKDTMMMEAFNVAANMEKKGIDIYLGLEEQNEDQDLKKVFHDLAIQELRHKKQIISMGMTLFGMPSEEEKISPEQEEKELKQQKTVIREFEVVARNSHWEPNVVKVDKGNTIVLKIKAEDAPAGFRQTAFMIDEFIGKGKEVKVQFIADTAGEFEWFSNVPTPGGNDKMKGKIVVMGENEPDDAL